MESKEKKKGSDEPKGRIGIKTQTDTGRGKGKLGRNERVTLTYIHYQM